MCKRCEYAPTTYEEYCMKSKCPNAYTDKARECGNNAESIIGENKYPIDKFGTFITQRHIESM